MAYLECATFCHSFKPIGSEDSGNPESSARIDVSTMVVNSTFGIAGDSVTQMDLRKV